MTVKEMYEQYGDEWKVGLKFGVQRDNLDYPEFCQTITEQVKDYLKQKNKNCEVRLEKVQKNGGKQIALIVKEPGQGLYPAIYMEPLYEEYEKGRTLNSIVKYIADTCMNKEYFKSERKILGTTGFDEVEQIIRNWDLAKNNVVFTVVGISGNEEYLSDCPYTHLGGDLAAVYKVYLGSNRNNDTYSIRITDQILSSWNINAAELHRIAMENTPKLFPLEMVSLGGMIERLAEQEELPLMQHGVSDAATIITNKQMINGAAALFYPGVIKMLSDMYPDGIVIAPSSVHEVIVMSAKDFPAERMDAIVQEVNAAIVSPEEHLSEYAHVYDTQTHLLYAPALSHKINYHPTAKPSNTTFTV